MTDPTMPPEGETMRLARFAAGVKADDIPDAVMDRIVDLFVDWAGSCLSGRGHRAIAALEAYAADMGPSEGPSMVLTDRRRTSPHFAAFVNGGAGHISEQDDVHNGSVFHPAAVVFPAALALAEANGSNGREFLRACIIGYEVGIRVGEFLGRSHYEIHHTTGTAGTLAAAAAAGALLRLDATAMTHALGSAGTRSAGLWEFLTDAADSKQLHTAAAACDGVMAATLASHGFTGARRILEGPKGLAAGTSRDADPARLVDGFGTRWTVLETSFKYHASCRHTHPSADALLQVVTQHDLAPDAIASIEAGVSQGALDVLGPVTHPRSVHQAKFSMPMTLGLIAVHRQASLERFAAVMDDDAVWRFNDRVTMRVDPKVDGAYPRRWLGRVRVTTRDGRTLEGRVDEPKGDPGNTLSRAEVDEKARRLALSSGAVLPAEIEGVMATLWTIGDAQRIASGHLLPSRTSRPEAAE